MAKAVVYVRVGDASGQRRITGISAQGEADVTFDALPSYKGYTVTCSVD